MVKAGPSRERAFVNHPSIPPHAGRPSSSRSRFKGSIKHPSIFASARPAFFRLFAQPLQEATDPETGRRYLLCEFNRDASSYRSPWSNKYDPPLEDGYTPGDRVRQMEASQRLRPLRPVGSDRIFEFVYLLTIPQY